MIWQSILEVTAKINFASWVALIIFGSTCIDRALKIQGSLSFLAIKDFNKLLEQRKKKRLQSQA